MTPTSRTGLVRAIGRFDLTALVINAVIGSGIFGLPAIILGLVGAASPVAFLLAGAAIAVIALCFAEVASRFDAAGGPYLYAREAFGSFLGLQIGWITWLVRITSAAANANLFVLYLAELWGRATEPAVRMALLTVMFGLLAIINYRGVKQGARVSTVFALAKLVPLALFIVVGLWFIESENFRGRVAGGLDDWTQAMLLLVFAYGGFEAAMIPAGEVKNPQRDCPFALLVALAVIVGVYMLVQAVVVGTLPPGVETDRPLAAAANEFLGRPGGLLLAVGALVSVSGLLSGTMLNSPRLTYALAERGDFPAFFAAVHARFRTPHVSILLYAALSWVLAVAGTFQWNATLSAVARLLIYASTCAALLAFRRRAGRPAFRLPAGPFFAVVGIGFSAWLVVQMGRAEFVILGGTVALAAATWLWARRRG
ncbi:MAG: amino acid permease [Acidobacteria bacterium]|nr:amino acid permease [Acidobacteriota bacterium]